MYIQFFGVQFYNTSSVCCILCLPLQEYITLISLFHLPTNHAKELMITKGLHNKTVIFLQGG